MMNGISALFCQRSFSGETSSSVAKCQLSSDPICLQTGSCYRSMAFPRRVRVLLSMSHIAICHSEGCEFEMGKIFLLDRPGQKMGPSCSKAG